MFYKQIIISRLTKKDKQRKKKEHAEGNDESLDMIFLKIQWKLSTQILSQKVMMT
jgi:hypothetical protein